MLEPKSVTPPSFTQTMSFTKAHEILKNLRESSYCSPLQDEKDALTLAMFLLTLIGRGELGHVTMSK